MDLYTTPKNLESIGIDVCKKCGSCKSVDVSICYKCTELQEKNISAPSYNIPFSSKDIITK